MDDAAARRHPFDVAFRQSAAGILHRAVQHEGYSFQPGMGMRLAETAFQRDVVVRHQEERVGGVEISRCHHQRRLVTLAIEAGSERRYCGDAINRSVKHCPFLRVLDPTIAGTVILPVRAS